MQGLGWGSDIKTRAFICDGGGGGLYLNERQLSGRHHEAPILLLVPCHAHTAKIRDPRCVEQMDFLHINNATGEVKVTGEGEFVPLLSENTVSGGNNDGDSDGNNDGDGDG